MKTKSLFFLIGIFLAVLIATSCHSSAKKVEKPHHMMHQQMEEVMYTCPMHPEVVQNEPGKCPKCGMTLVKKEKGQCHEAGHSHEH